MQAATYRSVSGSPAVVVEPTVHLVVDGQSFATVLQYCPELLPRVSGRGHLEVGPSGGGVLTLMYHVQLLVKGTVFARMSPPLKQQLVERLQGIG